MKVLKKLMRLLIQGIILIAPLALTIYLLFELFLFLDSFLSKLLGDIPGLGILILILVLIFIGYLGSTFISDPIRRYFNRLLNKIPVIKLIYRSVKDIISAFTGNKKKFNSPVMVKEHANGTCYKIGFITQSNLSNIGISEGLTAVYFPHSYAISGVLMLVENESLQAIDASAGEVMKFIVSGGVLSGDVKK